MFIVTDDAKQGPDSVLGRFSTADDCTTYIMTRPPHRVENGEYGICPTLAYPGEPFDGRTVIASGELNDEYFLYLLLNPSGMFYSVVEVAADDNTAVSESRYTNIVPATAAFHEAGGFWGES